MTRPLSLFTSNFNTLSRCGVPLGRAGRVLLLLWSALLLSGFGLAATVSPDPRGFGTHERLGLPPCRFMSLVQRPCPSCGMTTSFAHFVRGEWGAAGRSNAAGLLLAVVCLVQIPWCWIGAALGRLWLVWEPERTLVLLIGSILAVTLLQWSIRLFF